MPNLMHDSFLKPTAPPTSELHFIAENRSVNGKVTGQQVLHESVVTGMFQIAIGFLTDREIGFLTRIFTNKMTAKRSEFVKRTRTVPFLS